MANSIVSDFVNAVNGGSCVVRSTVAGELTLPIEVVDDQGRRVVRVTMGSLQRRDLLKAVPRQALLGAAVVRQRLLDGSLVLDAQ